MEMETYIFKARRGTVGINNDVRFGAGLTMVEYKKKSILFKSRHNIFLALTTILGIKIHTFYSKLSILDSKY